MYKSLTLAFFFIMMSGFSCSVNAPHDPVWNKEACAHCRMILSEPRYAAQLVGPGNRTRYYDDIGCALAHMNADPQLKKGKLYVRPFGGDVWVEASKARYVDKQLTPMNSGVGAVAEGGTLDFEAVERLVAEGLHEHR